MKQMVVALFFVALCCVAKVQADKCYSCSSTESWGKCNGAKKEMTCSSAKCMKLKVSTEIKASGANITKTYSYIKGCGSAAACEINNNPLCKISLPGKYLMSVSASSLNSSNRHETGEFGCDVFFVY
ncbi:uncharacterized protein LOC116289845 [Actinia tenebrosa]|uniref:Uncharacterized protein LOC116289845 n=1 Tax=Actinia tenebrosa TaxID=6105 RepID=A0A6P8HJ60_ACTTE|nr:uncharacterized protein LOC116289845 [Actinia tenebrosa]